MHPHGYGWGDLHQKLCAPLRNPGRAEMYLHDSRWIEFSKLSKEDSIAIIPVAVIEQTGPFLPAGKDFFIA